VTASENPCVRWRPLTAGSRAKGLLSGKHPGVKSACRLAFVVPYVTFFELPVPIHIRRQPTSTLEPLTTTTLPNGSPSRRRRYVIITAATAACSSRKTAYIKTFQIANTEKSFRHLLELVTFERASRRFSSTSIFEGKASELQWRCQNADS
jgi:hypothetical protein